MVEGAIRHGTTMTVEGNYTDTHGQSEIGFGITPAEGVFDAIRLVPDRAGRIFINEGLLKISRPSSPAKSLGYFAPGGTFLTGIPA